MVALFVLLVAVPVRSEQVADVKGPVQTAQQVRLSADSFYKPGGNRDPSWPAKLEIVVSPVKRSAAQFKEILKSQKIWNIRYHCDGYPFFAPSAGVESAAKDFLSIPLQFMFNVHADEQSSYLVLNPSPYTSSKYKYRIEGQSGGKFIFHRGAYRDFKLQEEPFSAQFVEIQRRDDSGVVQSIDTAIEIEGPKMCDNGKKPVRQLLILPKPDVIAQFVSF